MRYWHGKPCEVITKAPFYKGVKRNALVKLKSGMLLCVPFRAIRRKPERTVNPFRLRRDGFNSRPRWEDDTRISDSGNFTKMSPIWTSEGK
ncbi:MAG: hypothetical protein HOC20_06675 [Chloroflexi bacterium]|nr:hypothetical protein [Chloroflexota bacterium]